MGQSVSSECAEEDVDLLMLTWIRTYPHVLGLVSTAQLGKVVWIDLELGLPPGFILFINVRKILLLDPSRVSTGTAFGVAITSGSELRR
jgi:hypothetical protein